MTHEEYLRTKDIESLIDQAQRDLGRGDGSRRVSVDLGEGVMMSGDWIERDNGIMTVFSSGLGTTTSEKAPISLCRSISLSSTDRLHTHVAPDHVREASRLATVLLVMQSMRDANPIEFLQLPAQCDKYGVLENMPDWERSTAVDAAYPLALKWLAGQDVEMLADTTLEHAFEIISRDEANLKDIASGRLDFDEHASEEIKAFGANLREIELIGGLSLRRIVEDESENKDTRLSDIDETRRTTISVRLLDLKISHEMELQYRPYMHFEELQARIAGILKPR